MHSETEIILDNIYRDESDQDISLLIFHIEKENETIASGMLPIAAVPGAKELLHSVTVDDLLEYCRDNADKIDISSMPVITEASPITRFLVEDITRSENNMLYYFQNDPDEEDNLDFITDYLPKGYDWAADLNRDIQKFHLENLVEFYTNSENAPITPDSEVSLVCYANLQAVFLHPAAGHERLKEELNQEVNIMNTVEETFYYQFAHKGLNGHCPEKLVNISNEKETWESLSDITCAAQYGVPKNYSVTNDENGLLHANINGKDTVIGTYFTVQDDDWYEIVGLAGQALDSDDLQHTSIPGGQKNMQSLYNNVLKIAEGKLQPPKPSQELVFTTFPKKEKLSLRNTR